MKFQELKVYKRLSTADQSQTRRKTENREKSRKSRKKDRNHNSDPNITPFILKEKIFTPAKAKLITGKIYFFRLPSRTPYGP